MLNACECAHGNVRKCVSEEMGCILTSSMGSFFFGSAAAPRWRAAILSLMDMGTAVSPPDVLATAGVLGTTASTLFEFFCGALLATGVSGIGGWLLRPASWYSAPPTLATVCG